MSKDPGSVADVTDGLRQSGYLPGVPKDPYGGRFFIGADGKVDTTSHFAFAATPKK